MDIPNYKRTKRSCYAVYLATASVFSLPPLLFGVFREMYGISYTLLGTLVLINFCTQLGIDLVFSFFSRHFDVHKSLRAMPVLTALGLCVYALFPAVFPTHAYAGLAAGTVLFSVSAGLGEVLVSPTIAALPSDTPDRDMSMLHSLYGYGFTGVVLVSTLFLQLVGKKYWMYLTLVWAVLPVIAAVMLMLSPLPDMNMAQAEKETPEGSHRKRGILLCMACIFLGGCTENTMTNWISAYAENALHIPKLWGDVLGMALFAVLLALTRTAYAKYGKNISRTLMVSMAGSVVCYIAAALSPNAAVSLVTCVALGVFTAMLWPGTLILMEEKIPAVGVAAYALMAAGGDLGSSLAPQALGIVVDRIALTNWAGKFGNAVSLSPEQVGFKVGILFAAAFPAAGILLLLYMKRFFDRKNEVPAG